MRILVEGYRYRSQDVEDVVWGINALEYEGDTVVDSVGYFYNSHPNVRDCVFVLPKVLLEDKDGQEQVFGKYKPEDIINIDEDSLLTKEERNFIFEFSVWIYRAIVVYEKDKRNDTSIVRKKKVTQVKKGQRQRSNTFLDILLSLVRFNKDNQSFFMFIVKNQHSGLNKINWTRTIARTDAIIQDNSAVYSNPVNKRRSINFDEELLIIFFSILNYIEERYGFDVNLNCQYELITGNAFKRYLKGYGKLRLRQIKYKYFSDKALELWELCYAFFDRTKQATIDKGLQDYLMVQNFNIVFEAIIDELIGDKDVPRGLKKQEDGKMVDHMYAYEALTTADDEQSDKKIYYIGDSKYYKRGHKIGDKSVAKQFTYARNVIQWNLNLFLNQDPNDKDWKHDWTNFHEVPKLRDDVTEGYNIIPNFFISATIDEELSYKDTISLTKGRTQVLKSEQFKNRLFDRDTLLISHYDVNFLYVVSLYALNNKSKKNAWKKKVREIFREQIRDMLKTKYNFFVMSPKNNRDAERYIKSHFQDVLGKVYSPYDTNYMSLALDNTDPEGNNEKLLEQLRNYFVVAPCKLGENPQKAIEEFIRKTPDILKQQPEEKNVLTGLVRKTDTNFKNFSDHTGTSYTMEKIPSVNLMDIKFFLPMVAGAIDGYYEVNRVAFTTYDGQPALRLRLGRFIPIGEDWVQIYKSKMQPGELISYEVMLNLYKE